jgi:serine/threonine-protein kinase
MNSEIKKTNLFVAALVSGLFIFASFQTFPFFEALERVIYSVEMRLDLPAGSDDHNISIVNIDEKSLERLGPWPWPRYLIAEMIAILKANGAKLIGLDFIFNQKEQNQGLQEVRRLREALMRRNTDTAEDHTKTWILEKLTAIEKRLDNDHKLVATVRDSGNIILPVVGKFGLYDTELIVPLRSFLSENSLGHVKFKKRLENYISVKQLAMPFQELSENSLGLGHINFSPNNVLKGQVHLPFINYRGRIIPSMALRLALEFANQYPAHIVVTDKGIRVNQDIIPTTNGEILIKFKGGRRSFPHYSFVDILKVKKVPDVFEDKIVLMGFAAAEEGIAIPTPVDPKMPRVELTANILEDLMTGRYLTRPETMVYIEAILILLLGFVVAMLFPRLNYFPRTAATAALLLGVLLSGFVFFLVFDIWFKTIYICLSVATLYLVFTVMDAVSREKSIELSSQESIETNKMLGLSLQSQGLLDLAFEKFRKCPPDEAMKDVLYNLGLDFERKRMLNKAISVYDYIIRGGTSFRDLSDRLPKLRKLASSLPLGSPKGAKQAKILLADELETKPTVGRYEILAELGQGAMGMVYKALDPKINREVAIKTIRFSDEFEEDRISEVKERFFKEAELAGSLSHPSIIAIYDVGEDYDLTYMTMELLDGRDLEEFCQKETLLPVRQVLDVIIDAAEALDYAHGRGVVHRDVKPANIMLLKDGRIKVMDFGIAKAVSSSQTKTGIILGTPNYMSPEQINGQIMDGRSDIFSLGVVFYQLLTGVSPFRGKTLTELFYQITQVKHPSPSKINPRVIKPCEKLLDKALAKDPSQRFQRATDLARYLKIIVAKLDGLKTG